MERKTRKWASVFELVFFIFPYLARGQGGEGTSELEIKFGESINFWKAVNPYYNMPFWSDLDSKKEKKEVNDIKKVAEFSITFEKILEEVNKKEANVYYIFWKPGKRVKLYFRIENLGPKRAYPDISDIEMKLEEGSDFKYHRLWSKVWVGELDPGQRKEGILETQIIPEKAVPLEITGRLGGIRTNSGYYYTKRFRLKIDGSRSPAELILEKAEEAAKKFLEKKEAIIDSITPISGAPGIEAVIIGKNLNSVKLPIANLGGVNFGKMTAKTISWEDERIVVRVPSGEGRVKVQVDSNSGAEFTFLSPTIQKISPPSFPMGSEGFPSIEITLTGKDFGFPQTLDHKWVKFGYSMIDPEAIIEWSDKRIIFKTPSDGGTGWEIHPFVTNLFSYGLGLGFLKTAYNLFSGYQVGREEKATLGKGKKVEVIVRTSAGTSNPVKFTYQPSGKGV